MTKRNTRASAPSLQTKSARHGQQARPIVSGPRNPYAYQTRRQYDEQLRRNFKCGLYLGLAIGLGVMALIMWFWTVPTVDSCVENMKQLEQTMMGVSA